VSSPGAHSKMAVPSSPYEMNRSSIDRSSSLSTKSVDETRDRYMERFLCETSPSLKHHSHYYDSMGPPVLQGQLFGFFDPTGLACPRSFCAIRILCTVRLSKKFREVFGTIGSQISLDRILDLYTI
jgi:hypothetical protein